MKENVVEQWNVDLTQQWAGVSLPVVQCEIRNSASGFLEGRCMPLGAQPSVAPWVDLSQPVLLQTHREPKPWGAEIWYTGIEKRGVCSVRTLSGACLSLPEYLTLLAGPMCDVHTPPLLKILDPLPDPQRGSLYIEVHEEKWETYIVTGVSPDLYPSGEGELLFGFSQQKLATFAGDENKFRSTLLVDVQRYEAVRRVLDGEQPAETLASVGLSVSQNYQSLATELWNVVRSYFTVRKVRVGDVVQVPTFIPHSLQPGVRVVEFQTPTYERLILAFNQKVLTQSHWDSEGAIQKARFVVPESAVVLDPGGWQRIVEFPEFSVHRRSLLPNEDIALNKHDENKESLLFVISGEISIYSGANTQELPLSAEQAAFLPKAQPSQRMKIRNASTQPALVLVV